MHDINDYPDARMTPGLLVYRSDAPLYFANARDFRERAMAAADAHADGLRWFVLNVEANVEIDITAMDAVAEVRTKLADRGIVFALARVKRDVLEDLQKYGLADLIGTDRLFPTLPTAEAAFRAWESEQGSV
jgi:MFS superfamily sulfate permease-like transporter